MTWWDVVRDWIQNRRTKSDTPDFPVPSRELPDNLVSYDGANEWLRRRLNLSTRKKYAQIRSDVPAKVRAHCFFSARVAEDHILDKLRAVSDAFTRGEIGQAEARTKLKQFLIAEGYDPRKAGLKNLASTARLNLILEQNARMAAAVGRYQAGRDPDIEERFPCWRYIGSTAMNPRDSHAKYAGHVYRKSDPVWHRIFPPSDFGCKCSVEDCDDPAEESPVDIEDPESGFKFDPAEAFSGYDLRQINDPDLRFRTREGLDVLTGQNFVFQDSIEGPIALRTPRYKDSIERGFESVSTWTAEPFNHETDWVQAEKQLKTGIQVVTPEKQTVTMGQEMLDHWTQQDVSAPKPQKEIEKRLKLLDCAKKTLADPQEIWEQETQRTFFKRFEDSDGKKFTMMVTVTSDGKCRSYMVGKDKYTDKARKGLNRVYKK